MTDKPSIYIIRAIQDFRKARRKASLREIIARLTGESTELLSFEEVRLMLKAQVSSKKVIKDIPISAIIGSVNRYQDFDRSFLPRRDSIEERWTNVDAANQEMLGLPPIEAYQIDQVYFVSDGNHRVSVAKELGATEIQAYVTEVHSRVTLTDDVSPEELIIKAEYAEFLENTNLDKSRLDINLTVTEPGQYEVIEEHIAVHRHYMGLEQQHEISYSEAAIDWYDTVYFPVVSIIRDKGLLLDFPNRTEADLYLWIADHRAALEDELKGQVTITSAIEDLADQFSHRTDRVISRIGNKIIRVLVPDTLESGPPTGEWRQSILSANREARLFCEILVPINGLEDGWNALDQALVIAKREGASIHGLFVSSDEATSEVPNIDDIQVGFAQKCEVSDVQYDLQIKSGDITANICELARWSDLVVINLTYPPESNALARLQSGIRNLIQKCPRPILFTPQVSKPIENVLLAYDKSLKAQEALFIAAYIAGQWEIPLHVMTLDDEKNVDEIQDTAQVYLKEQHINTDFVISKKNNSVDEILEFIDRMQIDLLLIGGYSRSPLIEIIQGSDVDDLLSKVYIPTLVCR
jgi:nucleotide-binding universal stress UspA family protein